MALEAHKVSSSSYLKTCSLTPTEAGDRTDHRDVLSMKASEEIVGCWNFGSLQFDEVNLIDAPV